MPKANENLQFSAKSRDTTKQVITMATPKHSNMKISLYKDNKWNSNVRRVVAKRLKALITPDMHQCHMIESTQEFIEIVKTMKQPKLLASLHVESLFKKRSHKLHFGHHMYNHPDQPPPTFTQDILRDLLLICPTETPFRAPDKTLH